MEMGEAVSMGVADVEEQDAPTCAGQTDDGTNWKARVNGKGQDTKKCSGTELYNLMLARGRAKHLEKGLGVIPEKMPNAHWTSGGLDAVTQTSFPVQAHHLIPKNFLPKHDVCKWLCKSSKKLKEDTFYNTDHPNNGLCMPYASPLSDWKAAAGDSEKKTIIAFAVMRKAGIQLHQGSHADDLDMVKLNTLLGSSVLPAVRSAPGGGDSDELEESEIHGPGYLNAIGKWLNAVHGRIQEHVEACNNGCKKRDGSKVQFRPLRDTVRLMNRVSYIAKVFLDLNIIHTCPYGAAYAASKRLLVWDATKERYHVHKEAPPQPTSPLDKSDIQNALNRTK